MISGTWKVLIGCVSGSASATAAEIVVGVIIVTLLITYVFGADWLIGAVSMEVDIARFTDGVVTVASSLFGALAVAVID